MTELFRHNWEVEGVENEKLLLEKLKEDMMSKSDDVDYKVKLVENYNYVKGTIIDHQIFRLFPEM